MKQVLAFFLTLCLTSPAAAQSERSTAEKQAALRAAVVFVQSPAQQGMIDAMLDPATIMARNAFVLEQIPAGKAQRLVSIITEEFSSQRPHIEKALILSTADTFTAEEIYAMNEFYSSAVGRSIMAKMQPYMEVFSRTMSSMTGTTINRVVARAHKEIR